MSKNREIELPLLCEEPKEDDFSPLFEVPLRNEELTSVAKERLKLLNKNRKRNESLFPLVKKKSKLSYNSKVSVNRRISDVYDFLDSEVCCCFVIFTSALLKFLKFIDVQYVILKLSFIYFLLNTLLNILLNT